MLPNATFTILGASDTSKLAQYTGINIEYQLWIESLAIVCRQFFNTLYFIPDHGTYVDFAAAFKNIGGTIIAVLTSKDDTLIQNASILGAQRMTLQGGVGWNYLNTNIIGLAPLSICLSLSAGSMLEICSAKYIETYQDRTITILVDKRGISGPLPLEVASDLRDLRYFDSQSTLESHFKSLVKESVL